MVTLIILFFLGFGFLAGLKRGFVLQVFHLVGFIIAFIVAYLYYDKLSSSLAVWVPYTELPNDSTWASFLQSLPLEKGFYNAISFAIIFFATKIVLQIIASMLDFVAYLPILKSINKLAGAILGFVEIYLILFVILYILALTPMSGIQVWLNSSTLALFIIEHTPILSELIKSSWFAQMNSILTI
ncbi:CvpA family protein [Virgibacillus alimentarius]|uniref:Membrane protein required for colicin V production n=1 Tax=Virgibacillus alimentarius TaxID=698769 RepID=A0ABS4S8G1_9BACI|nr:MULTISPECIES: CvpA family protein [Virgibacillus]MBP2256687.1 putative membrane protein required for colicin V production [Virgibacillus alimentarius]HLR67149.1 CvpA family protein [Virgibacillus sp.]